MKTIKVKVFEYSELEDKAKEKARQWFQEGIGFDDYWYDFIKEGFHNALNAMGFNNVDSQFSGFHSQGDGASFDFKGLEIKTLLSVKAKKIDFTVFSDILESWKQSNKELLRNILRFEDSLYCKSDKTSYSNHYCHSKTRFASVDFGPYSQRDFKRAEKFTNDFQEALTGLMEDLANCYYKALDSQWDYLNSEESIKEGMEANGYTFCKDGKRFG